MPDSMESAIRLAGLLWDSGFVPDSYTSKGQVFSAIQMGAELGLSPMRSLNCIFMVKNKPGLSSEAMVGLIKAHPACMYWSVVETTPDRCVIETHRRGSPAPERVEWTIERARKLGAVTEKSQYPRQPGVMIRHRAESELGRMVYPDVLGGMYSLEEIATMREGAEPDAPPQRTSLIPSADALPRIGPAVKQIPAEPARSAADVIEGEREAEPVRQPEPAKTEAPKANAADELTTMVNRIGKLTHPFMPDEMKPAELRAAIRKFSPDDIADILTQCEAATRDPDEGDALLRALAGDILRGPASHE